MGKLTTKVDIKREKTQEQLTREALESVQDHMKKLAEEICGVQPMSDEVCTFKFKIRHNYKN